MYYTAVAVGGGRENTYLTKEGLCCIVWYAVFLLEGNAVVSPCARWCAVACGFFLLLCSVDGHIMLAHSCFRWLCGEGYLPAGSRLCCFVGVWCCTFFSDIAVSWAVVFCSILA